MFSMIKFMKSDKKNMVDGLNQSHAARGFGVPTLGMHKHAKREFTKPVCLKK